MAIAETPTRKTNLETVGIRRHAASQLANFDEEALRNALIQAAGHGLLIVAESSGHSLKQHTEAVRQSASDVDDISRRLSQVVNRVQTIDELVGNVVCGAQGGARELQKATAHLRGVSDEFQRLAASTHDANEEVKQALARVGQAIDDLSRNLDRSAQDMHRSIEVISVARKDASHVESDATRFHDQLHGFLGRLRQLVDYSARVESEMQEVDTIGSTFAYLLEMMAMQGAFDEALDPLARLFPLVRSSSFYDPHRFTSNEEEYVLSDEEIIVSATDPAGVITFANDRFYEVAEYSPGELTGQQHNIIRHPDMPRTTFADLWTVVQSGKTWQGYVLNRSKSGRVYWLKANIFPCFENGRVVGYISIRTKPHRAKIRQAIEVYRRMP